MKKSTIKSYDLNANAALQVKTESKLKRELIEFTNYYSEGVKLARSQPLKAIDYLNTALKTANTGTNKKKALQTRSLCYLRLGKATEALIDANEAVSFDQNDPQSILSKAEALYHKGEFEWALMYYSRGKRIRKNMQNFEQGVNKCRKAIERALADSTRHKLNLTDLYDDNDEESEEDETAQPLQEQHKTLDCTAENRARERKLLGEIYHDFTYLGDIHSETGNTDVKFNMKIKEICNNGLEYLNTRLEFLKQQE